MVEPDGIEPSRAIAGKHRIGGSARKNTLAGVYLKMVEPDGIEPTTSAMPLPRTENRAIGQPTKRELKLRVFAAT